MGEFILFVLIFVGVMAVAALIFGGWFLVMLLQGIGRFIGVLPSPKPPQIGPRRRSGAVQTGPVSDQRACPYELCKASNDVSARFCRRCGRQLTAPSHVHVRRAAVW
jgi:hypothetical protein